MATGPRAAITVDRLREAALLADLDDEELARLAASGHERRLQEGEFLFRQGDLAGAFHIVLDGQLETTRDVAGEQVLLMGHGPGGFLGAISLLTETPYRGSTFAVTATTLFELPGEELRRLAFTHASMMRRFLPALESVSGAVKGIERDREKLLAVGKLAAGLAHELNNPATVAARGAATLRDLDARRHEALAALAGSGATTDQVAAVAALGAEAGDGAVTAARPDPLAESDREQDVLDALGARGVRDGHEIATAFAEAGLGPEWIDRIAAAAGDAGVGAGLRHLAACAATRVVLAEVQEATTRIADLVSAVRDYSYLDQGPRQSVDIHEGLESTLALLAHKLREKQAVIVRDLDDTLPTVEASGSELNQVWTNLIDNAADAIAPGGRITLRTRAQGVRVHVEIADDGPGVPADLQARIFDAFFTTKPVGRGTGLGLDIAQRIVVRLHGELRLESAPGATRFQVVLPAG